MIDVLIVDDQPIVRAGLAVVLGAEPDLRVVGQAADGEEAVRLAASLRPDVVCMDLRMPVLDGIATGDHAYFVHSWQMRVDAPAQSLAHADHGGPVTAVVGHGTVVGMQFHPEKSQEAGLRLLSNFLAWAP